MLPDTYFNAGFQRDFKGGRFLCDMFQMLLITLKVHQLKQMMKQSYLWVVYVQKCIFPVLILRADNHNLQPQPASISAALQAAREGLVAAVFHHCVSPLIICRQTTVIIHTFKYNLPLLWIHDVKYSMCILCGYLASIQSFSGVSLF